MPDNRAGVGIGSTFVMAGQPTGLGVNLVTSHDYGTSWTPHELDMDAVDRMEYVNGIIVVSGSAKVTPSATSVFVSPDLGDTWLPATMPFTMGSSTRVSVGKVVRE